VELPLELVLELVMPEYNSRKDSYDAKYASSYRRPKNSHDIRRKVQNYRQKSEERKRHYGDQIIPILTDRACDEHGQNYSRYDMDDRHRVIERPMTARCRAHRFDNDEQQKNAHGLNQDLDADAVS